VTRNIPDDQPVGLFAVTYFKGQPIAFGEDLSRVPNAPVPTTLQWRWLFGDGATATDLAPTHWYAQAGTYNVHVQIFDTTSASWTDLDSAQISVLAAPLPNPPIAKAKASAHAIPFGGSVTFDAGGSRAQDGLSLSYLWNFNDGNTATGSHVTHQFGIAGWGFVALIVTDHRGARGVATTDIVVGASNQVPSVRLTASAQSVHVGKSLAFAISQAPGVATSDQIVQYTWDFGDGSPVVVTRGPSISHQYQQTGAFTVTVHLQDQQGREGTARVVVAVVDPAANGGWVRWLIAAGLGVVALLGGGYVVNPAFFGKLTRKYLRGGTSGRQRRRPRSR
jgi:PKD repeat protein